MSCEKSTEILILVQLYFVFYYYYNLIELDRVVCKIKCIQLFGNKIKK